MIRSIILYKIKSFHYGMLCVLHIGTPKDNPRFPRYLHLPGKKYDTLSATVQDIPQMFTHAEKVLSPQEHMAIKDQPGNHIAEALGVKSLAELQRIAKIVQLIEEDGMVSIRPKKRVERGHEGFEGHLIEQVPLADTEVLTAAIERGLNKSTNLADWRRENPRKVKKKRKKVEGSYFGAITNFNKATGHATNQTSIDLSAVTYQDRSAFRSRIKKDIDNLANFALQNRGKDDLAEFPIYSRELQLKFRYFDEIGFSEDKLQEAINSEPVQLVLDEMGAYAQEKGVNLCLAKYNETTE